MKIANLNSNACNIIEPIQTEDDEFYYDIYAEKCTLEEFANYLYELTKKSLLAIRHTFTGGVGFYFIIDIAYNKVDEELTLVDMEYATVDDLSQDVCAPFNTVLTAFTLNGEQYIGLKTAKEP